MIFIGFSTSNAWYSRLIRWATGAKCSHTFLVVPFMGVQLVLEEGVFGYSARTLSNMQADGSQLVALMVPVVPLESAVAKSFDWLGQRYDYAGLLGMSWVMFKRWLGKKVRNPFASHRAMFCSESVTKVLQAANWPGAAELDPSATDPETLRKFIIESWARKGVQCER